MMKLYTYTTADEYELPLAVAESPMELARITGRSSNGILSCISHQKGVQGHFHWHRIDMTAEDEEEIRRVKAGEEEGRKR